MLDEPIQFGAEHNLFGIVSQPEKAVKNTGVLFLNAGFVYHVGPNRIHVELSRKMTELGYHCLRFDFSGFGESLMDSGSSTFEEYTLNNVKEAINVLSDNYGLKCFILFGICSGADIAFKASLEDQRITGCYLVNGSFHTLNDLEKIYPLAVSMTKSRYLKKNMFNPNKWIKLFSAKKLITIFKRLMHKLSYQNERENLSHHLLPEYTFDNWDNLISRNIKLKLVYAEGSDTLDIFNMRLIGLEKYIQTNQINFELFNDVDHVFTPSWSQKKLEISFIDWITKNHK